jgi:NADH-quinone oxidoreductase subunit C
VSVVADAVRSALGPDVLAADAGFGSPTLDVTAERWADAVAAAEEAGATYLDLLTAYDLEDDGFAVVAHVSTPDAGDHLLLRTRVPREAASLPSLIAIHRGAAWHERETHEMFGVEFRGHEGLDPLLLDPDVVTTPLRKDAHLVSRLAGPWPGDVDPGDAAGRPRRRTPPPGVPVDWERP